MNIPPIFYFAFSFIPLFLSCSNNSENSQSQKPFIKSDPHPLTSEIVNVTELKQVEERLETEHVFISSSNPKYAKLTTEYYQPEDVRSLVDILFIIDNSVSMKQEQRNLAGKFDKLMSSISETDWRINIITTDQACSSPDKLISADDADADEKFRKEIQVGLGGSTDEKGLGMAIRHIKGSEGCSIHDWTRENSKLAIIFVTDVDDIDKFDAKDYMDALLTLDRDPKDDIRTYGFISPGRDTCPAAEGTSTKYIEAMEISEGLYYPVCLTDYSSQLEEISEDIASTLNLEVPLKGIPKHIEAHYKNENKENQYVNFNVNGDILTLERIPEPGTTLIFEYYLATVTVIEPKFPMDAGVDLLITFNGTELPRSEYRIDLAKNMILFNSPLPVDTDIVVSYVTTPELKTKFSFPDVDSKSDIICHIDDEPIDFMYDKSEFGTTLEFYEPIAKGATVLCQYKTHF